MSTIAGLKHIFIAIVKLVQIYNQKLDASEAATDETDSNEDSNSDKIGKNNDSDIEDQEVLDELELEEEQ